VGYLRYIGRFLGLMTGLVILPNLFTALFGFMLGWVFDLGASASRRRLAQDNLNQALCLSFLNLAASLSLFGRNPQTAWHALKPYVAGKPFNLAMAERQFLLAQRQPGEVGALASTILGQTAGSRDQLEMVLSTLYYMSRRQGPSPTQMRILQRISEVFNVDLPLDEPLPPPPKMEQLNHEPPRPEQPQPEAEAPNPFKSDALGGRNPYFVLGLGANATEAQVKSAYRKLVAKHHPDRLRGAGASPKVLQEAEEKMRVYNAAYDILAKRQKG
jgi:hypothetical protein